MSFDYSGAHKAVGVTVSERPENISYLLPFAVDQGKLKVVIFDGFIRPAKRREDILMGFWFMGRQCTRASEIHHIHVPPEALQPRRMA